jgi:uncharacterized membrane protein HdeD (DUF308 family)
MTSQSDWVPGSLLSWRASFVFGLITLIFGVIVVARPTLTLNVIAVLLGVAMIASGVYHILRAIGGREHQRVWRGISGVVFILVGLALIRHLDLSVALIGLFIGFAWVVQGIATLLETVSGRRPATVWSLCFGVISLIAGIVVISVPARSVTALTALMGVWLIVIGLLQMFGALITRHDTRELETEPVNVPGQRAGERESREAAARAAAGRQAPPRSSEPS